MLFIDNRTGLVLCVEECHSVFQGRTGKAGIVAAEFMLETADIAGGFPLSHWQVMHKIVAAGCCCGARYLSFEILNEVKCLYHQLANLAARITSLYNKVIAGETSHRSPINNVPFPFFIIA